jgi:hypothetical protein
MMTNLFSAGLSALPASLALLIAILHLRYLKIARRNGSNNGESNGMRSGRRVAVLYADTDHGEDGRQRQWVTRVAESARVNFAHTAV